MQSAYSKSPHVAGIFSDTLFFLYLLFTISSMFLEM